MDSFDVGVFAGMEKTALSPETVRRAQGMRTAMAAPMSPLKSIEEWTRAARRGAISESKRTGEKVKEIMDRARGAYEEGLATGMRRKLKAGYGANEPYHPRYTRPSDKKFIN